MVRAELEKARVLPHFEESDIRAFFVLENLKRRIPDVFKQSAEQGFHARLFQFGNLLFLRNLQRDFFNVRPEMRASPYRLVCAAVFCADDFIVRLVQADEPFRRHFLKIVRKHNFRKRRAFYKRFFADMSDAFGYCQRLEMRAFPERSPSDVPNAVGNCHARHVLVRASFQHAVFNLQNVCHCLFSCNTELYASSVTLSDRTAPAAFLNVAFRSDLFCFVMMNRISNQLRKWQSGLTPHQDGIFAKASDQHVSRNSGRSLLSIRQTDRRIRASRHRRNA